MKYTERVVNHLLCCISQCILYGDKISLYSFMTPILSFLCDPSTVIYIYINIYVSLCMCMRVCVCVHVCEHVITNSFMMYVII